MSDQCKEIPPNSNGSGGHKPILGTAKQSTQNTVFLLGGLAYCFSGKSKEIFHLLY
jgi:hypothetical protein